MSLLKKIYSLFSTCCNTTDNIPSSPRPYRRKLPHTHSVYKLLVFTIKTKELCYSNIYYIQL